MKNKILANINSEEQLEALYRWDKKSFEKSFNEIYPEISGSPTAVFWNARLNFETSKERSGPIPIKNIVLLILVCVISGFLIKIPQFFDLDLKAFAFYEKNAGLIVLLGLSLFAFLSKDAIKAKQCWLSLGIFVLAAIYVNLLPSNKGSHSITLVYIHLPLLLWSLYGLIYIDFDLRNKARRMDYLRHNGDLAILSALLLITGGILTGMTFGLFWAIELHIEDFYMEYVVLIGAVSIPVVAGFIIRHYPALANKIAPILANIFSPLVLVTLLVYLISIVVTGKDPYNDRDFLLVFNLMLLGVMALVVFSISETSTQKKQRFNLICLFALAIVSLLIDVIALSAIIYRLGEYGFTPNRTAVLGSNLLIFGNLLLIMIDLYRVLFKNKSLSKVESSIGGYMSVYVFWTLFVVFVLPWIFGLS